MIDFITVTGRRVSIRPMTGQEEHMILTLSKQTRDKNRGGSQISRKLIDQLVVESDPPIDHQTLLLGEEFDLLYLIRLAALGSLYEFKIRCVNDECNRRNNSRMHTFEVDIRNMRRDVLVCGNKGCACHKIREDVSKICNQEMPDGLLSVDFSGIHSTHYQEQPKLLEYELPVSGYGVEMKLPLAIMKDQLGAWAEEEDPKLLSKYLSRMTIHFNNISDMGAVEQLYDDLTTYDRLWIRDKMYDEDPGVDTELEITCPKCYSVFEAQVDIGGPFFLPKRATLAPWHGLLLRYLRETGMSHQSWICHSMSEQSC